MTFLGLDPTEWLAILTAVLVGVTGLYAWLTWRLSGHAQSSAVSAAESAKAARRALQLGAMPIMYARSAVAFPPVNVRVWVVGLTMAPAFRLQATVIQGDSEWPGGLVTYLRPTDPDTPLAVDIKVEAFPNLEQPYDVTLTYSDATGTYYRSTRSGYINGSDFKLEELTDAEEWEQLV